MVAGAVAWPLSGLRGMPWLGRTLRAFGGGANAGAVTRTVALSVLGVVVFGLLFASADAIVGQWLGSVLPDIEDDFVLRLFLTVAVGGTVLAAAYGGRPSTASSGSRRSCSSTPSSCCSWRRRLRPSSGGTTTSSARPG
jgi:hypothetical protein